MSLPGIVHWNAGLFVEEALPEESVPHCAEAEGQGMKHRVQEPSCALQAGWSVVSCALGLLHPGLMGLMLSGAVCVILEAGIAVQKRTCVP